MRFQSRQFVGESTFISHADLNDLLQGQAIGAPKEPFLCGILLFGEK
jgi:hypothetical protein